MIEIPDQNIEQPVNRGGMAGGFGGEVGQVHDRAPRRVRKFMISMPRSSVATVAAPARAKMRVIDAV